MVKEGEIRKTGQTTNTTQTEAQEQTKEDRRGQLTGLLTEHLNAIRENTAKVRDLRKALEGQAQESIKTTYASVTAKASKRQPQEQTLHSIIIASKDTTESGEEVMGQIREAVNAKEVWVTIDRVRKAKDRK
ncbi:unnamed protein product [Arctia plantaginis]|uniref:Uncharacterized protein n=1 Tax=Arctia plantaginis TaxID=874455 RepID=A0A8S0YNC1_ARCPL|nr:unnamed protein product [Arctia plantaginis]